MNLTIGYQDVCVVSGGKEKCAHALEKYKCARVNMHFIYIERKQKMVMHLAHVTGV